MKIENKQDMYNLLRTGILGNTFRTWSSYTEAVNDHYLGPFGMRLSVVAGPKWNGDMPWFKVLSEIEALPENLRDKVILCEAVPNECAVLHAEAQLTPAGLYLKYRCMPGHMREAMKKPNHKFGLDAWGIVRQFDFDDLKEQLDYLLTEYDGPQSDNSAIVEFTVFEECKGEPLRLGMLNKSYAIWEVRSY